jgi:NAD(P)-dependent dehydrogenase (short-subunit alcohol dehydrogenase family)
MSRVAFVTGAAGSGIGARSCAALADAGFTVAAADIRGEGAKEVAAGLSGSGHLGLTVDVTDEASVHGGFDEAEATLGPVTVLVCSAGIMIAPPGKSPSIAEIDPADWDRTFAVNTRGPFFCIREYLSRRRETPVSNGRIITLSSAAAQSGGVRGGADYAASKAAVLALTKTVAREAAELGATANAIAPGPVDTPLFREMWPPGSETGLIDIMPFRRLIEPEEIAALVAFLASDAAANISGSTIDINGGYQMR